MRIVPAGWACGGEGAAHSTPRVAGKGWRVFVPVPHQTRVSQRAGQQQNSAVVASASRSWWPWGSAGRETGPSIAASLVEAAPASSSNGFAPASTQAASSLRETQAEGPSSTGSSTTDRPSSLAHCLAQLLACDVPEPSHSQVQAANVRFEVPEFVTSPSQRLVVVGSVPALGSWDVTQGARMTWHKGHRWTAQVQLDPGWHGALEFKVVMAERNHYTWEPGSNRLLVVERPRLSSSTHRPASDSSGLARLNGNCSCSSSSRSSSPVEGSPSRASSPGLCGSPSPGAVDDCSSHGSVGVLPPGPVLHVQCEWGKPEAPRPALPPTLQCAATTPGLMADGTPVGAVPHTHMEGAAAVQASPVIMANCQVVVPLLEQDSAAASLAAEEGVQLMLVGNLPALGCWAPALGLPLACDESGMWRARLELPMGYPVHAKLVLWDNNTHTARMWEPGPNRVVRLPDAPASMQHNSSNKNHVTPAAGSTCANPHSSAHSTGTSLLADSAAAGLTPLTATPAGRMPFPVMSDGEFMLLMHWSLPTFPHLVFLPSLDHHAPPRQHSPGRSNRHNSHSSSSHVAVRSLSLPPRPQSVRCRFTLPHFPTHPHQQVMLVGSHPALGSWDPTRGLRLQWGPGHSWQASVHLPADEEFEAKVVVWDGTQFKFEEGPNRRLRPGQLVEQVAPPGCWGEVLHCLYWGTHALAGRTPAVVVPHDMELASAASSSANSTAGGVTASSILGAGTGLLLASIAAPPAGRASSASPQPPSPAVPGVSTRPGQQMEPGLVLLGLTSLLTAAVLSLRTDLDGFGPTDGSSNATTAAAVKVANQVASLEASLEATRQQLLETAATKQREVDTLRQQLCESGKALAAEEDHVESLHAQLAQRGAELRSLTEQLARAEATAAAAMAAATTALSTSAALGGAGLLRGFAGASMDQAGHITPQGLVESMQQLAVSHSSNGNSLGAGGAGGMPAVAVATFQKLTEQLAAVQLEADSARQALAEIQAQRITEAAHLRAEVSEAVASRHKDAEAARVAAAAAALAHQQQLSALQGALTDVQALRQREVTALQVRMEQMVAKQEKETARLARQLGQACAAAEALEAQLLAQRSATAALSASGSAELKRLRSLLSLQASELEALRGQLADGHAAQVLGRLGNGNGNGSSSSYIHGPSSYSPGSNGHSASSSNGFGHPSSNGAGYPGSKGHAAANSTVTPASTTTMTATLEHLVAASSKADPTSHAVETAEDIPTQQAAQAAAASALSSMPTACVASSGSASKALPHLAVLPATGAMASWLQGLSTPRNSLSSSNGKIGGIGFGKKLQAGSGRQSAGKHKAPAAAAAGSKLAGGTSSSGTGRMNNIVPLMAGAGGGTGPQGPPSDVVDGDSGPAGGGWLEAEQHLEGEGEEGASGGMPGRMP